MSEEAPHREAAACVERGIERYAEGAYDAAQRELEAALQLQPGHARALECLAWIKEVTNGRYRLVSGIYAAVREPAEAPPAEPLPPEPPAGRSAPRLPGMSQFDETPDSVTREWSSMATSALPQLDVPELSEEQIANLLELDGGRGFTLSRGAPPAPAPPAPVATPADKDEDEPDEERESTHVRLASRVVELVAEAEETPPPALSPFATGGPDGDDAASMPTDPFVRQRLRELAGPLLQPSTEELPPPPSSPTSPPRRTEEPQSPSQGTPMSRLRRADEAQSAGAIDAALRRGAVREAFEVAERLADAPGERSLEEQAVLQRTYSAIVGELSAVPRYGKASPNLDSRSAFMLSRMDGAMSADDLLDVSGMARPDALRVLARLVVTGVVIMKR